MAFSPVNNAPATSAFSPPAQMTEIVWAINPSTGAYDILNEFTPPTNQGNLQVIQSKILITLGTVQGEWAAQPDFGIPTATLKQNSDNEDVVAQVVANEILTVQNTKSVSILSFSNTPSTRLFAGSFSTNTVFGTTTVTVG